MDLRIGRKSGRIVMDTFRASAPLKELQHKFGPSRIASLRPQKSCSPSAGKHEVSLPKARTHVLLIGLPGTGQPNSTSVYRRLSAGVGSGAANSCIASVPRQPNPGSDALDVRLNSPNYEEKALLSKRFLPSMGNRRSKRVVSRLPSLTIVPIVNVFASLILGDPVALLNLALQLIAAAADDVEIIVRQLSPLLLHLSFDLLPVSFHAVPVHLWHSFYIVQYADKRKAPFPSSMCAGVGESGKQVLG